MSVLREFVSGEFWGAGDRLWYGSLGVSTLVHLGVMAILGAWLLEPPGRGEVSAIQTRFSPAETEKSLPRLETPLLAADPDQQESGGSSAGSRLLRDPVSSSLDVPTVSPELAAPAAWMGDLVPLDDLTDQVGAAPGHSGDPAHLEIGDGTGTGTGRGSGSGFFGVKAPGNRFVYVVDCSRSMNHPHPGEFKTRFKRLQFELIKSVAELDEPMEFFIIFFNNEPIPMPARTLQPARKNVQRHYLEWVSGVRARGGTDPRAALKYALYLEPDVIYFLTDGAFDKIIERDLKKLHQGKSAIHTLTFGNRAAEKLMKRIATRNNGEYHFVP